jgi:hypothetical protein
MSQKLTGGLTKGFWAFKSLLARFATSAKVSVIRSLPGIPAARDAGGVRRQSGNGGTG